VKMIGFDNHGNWFDLTGGITVVAVPDEEHRDVVGGLMRSTWDNKLSYVEHVWMDEEWLRESAHKSSCDVLDYFSQEEKKWTVS